MIICTQNQCQPTAPDKMRKMDDYMTLIRDLVPFIDLIQLSKDLALAK